MMNTVILRSQGSYVPRQNNGTGQVAHPRSNGHFVRFFLCLVLCQALSACSSGENGAAQAPPGSGGPVPVPVAPVGHGHFRGTATIGDGKFHAEALVTIDHQIRIFVGGPVTEGGAPMSGGGLSGDLLNPEDSLQFGGSWRQVGQQRSGEGYIVGQACAATNPGRFCGITATWAEFSITDVSSEGLAAEIRVDTGDGDETWYFDLSAWSAYYRNKASPDGLSGVYENQLAQFASADNIIIRVDDSRRLFFQDGTSGCTGNGTASPYLDGAYNLFEVRLTVENCDAEHAVLNTEYFGLAAETQNGYWDYDSWLVMIVAAPSWDYSLAAITMYARRL
jgi:hypothetical protein